MRWKFELHSNHYSCAYFTLVSYVFPEVVSRNCDYAAQLLISI
jgi:hypothetical protein